MRAVSDECKVLATKRLRSSLEEAMLESSHANTTIKRKFSDHFVSGLLTNATKLKERTDRNHFVIETLEANRLILEEQKIRLAEIMRKVMNKLREQENIMLDFRYSQTDGVISDEKHFYQGMVSDVRKRFADETERKRAMQRELIVNKTESKKTGTANKQLYEVLLTAYPSLVEILSSNSADLLERLATLATEDRCPELEWSEETCPFREKVHIYRLKDTYRTMESNRPKRDAALHP